MAGKLHMLCVLVLCSLSQAIVWDEWAENKEKDYKANTAAIEAIKVPEGLYKPDPEQAAFKSWPAEVKYQQRDNDITKTSLINAGLDPNMGSWDRLHIAQQKMIKYSAEKNPEVAKCQVDARGDCDHGSARDFEMPAEHLHQYLFHFDMPDYVEMELGDEPRALHQLEPNTIVSVKSYALTANLTIVDHSDVSEDGEGNFFITLDDAYVYLHRIGKGPLLDKAKVKVYITTFVCPGQTDQTTIIG